MYKFLSQKKMHEYYEKLSDNHIHKKDLRMVAEDLPSDVGKKKFWLATPKALEERIQKNAKENKNNCFYEIMCNSLCTYRNECKTCMQMMKNMGTRFYLDIEFPDPCDWLSYQTSSMEPLDIGNFIKEHYLKCLKEEYKEENYDITMMEISSHRPGKYSWHFVAKIWDKENLCEKLFYDCIAVFALFDKWDKKHRKIIDMLQFYDVNNNGEQIINNAVDDSVYANHKLFRTPHSHKYGKKTGPLLPKDTSLKFNEMLVIQQYTDVEKQLFDLRGYISTTKTRRSRLRNSARPSINNKRKRTVVESPELLEFEKLQNGPMQNCNKYSAHLYCLFSGWKWWNEMKICISKHFPTVDFNKAQYKTIHKIYIPLPDIKQCPMARGSNNGAHKSNSTFLFVYPSLGKIKWCCQDPICKSRGGFKYLNVDLDFKMKIIKEYNKTYKIKI